MVIQRPTRKNRVSWPSKWGRHSTIESGLGSGWIAPDEVVKGFGMSTAPKSIDEYLARVSPDRRVLLEKLRKTIHRILPDVEECISYSMPAFRLQGHVVAGFLATTKGCSYYPFSGSTLATLAKDVASYSQTKSALHFDAKRALPSTLVRTLLKARIAETLDSDAEKGRKKKGAEAKGTKRVKQVADAGKAKLRAKRQA